MYGLACTDSMLAYNTGLWPAVASVACPAVREIKFFDWKKNSSNLLDKSFDSHCTGKPVLA